MPRRVMLEPSARADVADAFVWYEQQRPGLGSEFLAEVARVLDAIEQHPEQHAIVRGNTRRALVHRFPYRNESILSAAATGCNLCAIR